MPTPAPVTVVVDEDDDQTAPRWWRYHTEILDHLRLPHRLADIDAAETFEGSGVLLCPAPVAMHDDRASEARRWVEDGGVLLSIGVGPLGAAFGVAADGTVAEGRVVITGAAGWIDPVEAPLFARGGWRLAVDPGYDAITVAAWADDSSPAAVIVRHGAGVAVFLGVDVWQSIVCLQQGDPVDADGEPAADGTADVDDGVLKADDGIVLSYSTDRAIPQPLSPPRPEERAGLEPVPVFHRPHADLWRRVLLQILIEGARRAGTVLPWVHYWPAGVPAVAHLSVDSDRNISEEAATTLDLFAELDVRVTWCHVYPGGYEPEIVERIGADGHEHALHFNAVGDADIASWGWPELRAQYAWAQAMTGTERLVSNKNHYTRWEGWTDFYDWCERLGIEIDESRGPSKRGNVGFPFGTCHLAWPMALERRPDVVMLPLHAQDLAWATHESVRDVILDQVAEHHGVAHFLFHPTRLHGRGFVRDACRGVVAEARRRGLPWWTAAELNTWERLRRAISLDVRQIGPGAAEIEVRAPEPVSALGIVLALPADTPTAVRVTGSVPCSTALVERHGRKVHEVTVDVPAGTTALRVEWPEADDGAGGSR